MKAFGFIEWVVKSFFTSYVRNMFWATIYGCSFHYAHTWIKSGIVICWRHLVSLNESSNPFLHHTCATCSELPSYPCTMVGHDKGLLETDLCSEYLLSNNIFFVIVYMYRYMYILLMICMIIFVIALVEMK